MSGDGRGQNKEAYDTGYSQAVTHPSTNPARQSLTSVIGREPVFPCGMVVDKEIIAKICSLIRGIEREGYLSSWLVCGCRATQGAVTTAVRKEGLLLCCCTCRLAFWARQSGLQ